LGLYESTNEGNKYLFDFKIEEDTVAKFETGNIYLEGNLQVGRQIVM
jgi:hypothetical protein